eukprot:4789949-Pleurochrysis_carterae.AAC.1
MRCARSQERSGPRREEEALRDAAPLPQHSAALACLSQPRRKRSHSKMSRRRNPLPATPHAAARAADLATGSLRRLEQYLFLLRGHAHLAM